MMNKSIEIVKNSLADNLLSLSGEILITAQSGYEKNLLDIYIKDLVAEISNGLKEKYDFLDVTVTQGLLDIGIKIFAYEKRVADKEFLDDFNDSLVTAMKALCEQQMIVIRVNIFGTFNTVEKRVTFRYINKNADVRYMVSEETKHGFYRKLQTPKFYLLCLSLIALSYFGYLYYLKYTQSNI